jgi:DNA polymerase-4
VSESRRILHVDMDAFFAAIEQRDDPALAGRPVLVGGAGPRGVVSAASYEARAFGCHSAQPMAVALRLCPDAVVRPPNGPRIRAASEQLFSMLHDVTPVVEPISVDEAFLDVTGCERLLGSAVDIARDVKGRVRRALRLTASVGVAPNKFLAKLASDLEKPDGLTVIEAETAEATLAPLPVGRLWGVGPATAARLEAVGVRTIGDLQAWDDERLERHLGRHGPHLARLSRGLDDRAVTPDSRARSISHERTFPVDVDEPEYVRDVLRGQVEQVGRRLRRHGYRARTVTLKIRYGQFETITRSTTLRTPAAETQPLLDAAFLLFDRWARSGFRPVRLIGMAAAALEAPEDEQLELFGDPERKRSRRLDRALDAIQDRFGGKAIRRGGGPPPEGPTSPRSIP